MTPVSETSKRGFALVLSLSLMAFILMLLLGLTALVRVETQSTETNMRTVQAKLNALLALEMAIGEVQQKLGPDQRISANAELLGTTHDSKAQWVGVWDSDPGSGSYGARLDWLVSQDPSVPEQSDSSQSVEDEPVVRLMQLSSVNNGGDKDFLRLPTQSVMGSDGVSEAGRFAWYVHDEGVKNLLNPRYSLEPDVSSHLGVKIAGLVDLKGDLFDSLTVRQPGLAGLDGFNASNNTANTLEKMSRSDSYENLKLSLADVLPAGSELLDMDDPSLAMNFSLHAKGLLTDVKAGGLRKNLTAAFYEDAEFAKLLADAGSGWDNESIFDQLNPGSTPEEDLGGPKWSQLRSYFNQIEALNPDGSIDMILPDTSGEVGDLDEVSAVTPVFTLGQMVMRCGLYRDAGGDYEPVIFIHPTIALWNPYNVSIDTGQDIYVEFAMIDADPQSNRYSNWRSLGYEVRLDDTEKDKGWFNADTFGTRWMRFKIPQTTILPGKSKIFAADQNSELVFSAPGEADATQNELVEGNNGDYGFYVRTGESFTLNGAESESDLRVRFRLSEKSNRDGTLRYYWNISNDPNFSTGHIQVVPAHCKYAALGWAGSDKVNNSGWGNDPVFDEFLPDKPVVIWGDFAEIGYKFYRKFSDAAYDAAVNNSRRIQWVSQNNPRASYYGAGYYKARGKVPPHSEGFAWLGVTTPQSPELDIQQNSDFSGTPVGYSMGPKGHDRAVMFEVPRADVPFVSLGQLGMANFSRTHAMGGFPSGNGWDYLYDSTMPAYPLGNSLLDPRLPKGVSAARWTDNPKTTTEEDPRGTHYDYSFHLNEALWDRYFLTSESGRAAELDEEDAAVVFPLSNSRLLPVGRAELSYRDLRDYDSTASKLIVDGAFNINSMNVESWKSLLSSFYGASVDIRDIANGGATRVVNNDDAAPFARLSVPVGEISTTADSSADQQVYTGWRSLSETQINDLAIAIVDEILARGADGRPFLSLAEFINRDPNAVVPEHQVRGVLQAAIDQAGLNTHLESDGDMVNVSEFDVPNGSSDNRWNYGDVPLEIAGSTLQGATGFLIQSDLLTKLAPVISARSDTFRVRAYGSAIGLLGETDAEAWCEAVIQRLPEYVDVRDMPETELSALTREANRKFGRRFIITQFRWLTEDEL